MIFDRKWFRRVKSSAFEHNLGPVPLSSDPLIALFVDHSGLPGGGQLGLARYLSSTAGSEAHVAVLGEGPAFDSVPSKRIHRMKSPTFLHMVLVGRRFINETLQATHARVIIANSLRSAAVVALTPRRAGIVYVYYLRVDMSRAKMSALRWVVLSKMLLPRFDGYLANSLWTATTIPDNLGNRPSRIAYPVSGTANLERIGTSLKLPSSPLTILSLSRVVPWKGIHVLVEALRLLSSDGAGRKFRAVIAGGDFHEESDYAATLRAELPSDVDVSFVGHQADVADLLQGSDVVVSCSVVPEPFGQVVAQGLAASRPVIATDAGGPREMVRHNENGLLVEPGDAQSLASALRRLVDEPGLLAELSGRARSTSSEFSDSVTTESLRIAIESIVAAVTRRRLDR